MGFQLIFLEAIDLSFAYDDRQIFSRLNFRLEGGKVLGLAGANGSGKSTLVSVLAGILKPDSGDIRLGETSGREARARLKKYSALLPQNVDYWLLGETVAEDLTLGLNLNDPRLKQLTDELIVRWSLTDLLDRPVETLSLGQKKRVALAAALAREPVAVFLDEPMSGLDWPGTRTMLDDLARLKASGVMTVLVTHEPSVAAALVDDWLLLKPGGEWLFGHDAVDRFEEFGVRPL